MNDTGDTDSDRPLVSVVMPCLDEEEAIGVCFWALASWLAERVAQEGIVFFTFFSFSLD